MRPRFSLVLAALLGLSWSAPAEAKWVFPYNHPDLKWYSIESEHFVVHYPKSRKKEGNDHFLDTQWTARKASKVAEEMYPRVCAEFNYFLAEKIHIVILNQSDDLEGFTVPNWDWIEISANPGGDFYRQRGRMGWLPDVLVHEFAHVVSLKANGTFAEGVQGVSIGGLVSDGSASHAAADVGAEVFLLDNDPFYWTEGGAEYWSDEGGYNWWTTSRDMHIRTTVLEDRLLSYDEWQTRVQTFRWGDGERGYQQGYSFALYLRERLGHDAYQKFALENARGWKADWNTNIERVTGVPARRLYDDWVVWLHQRYDAQYAEVRADGEVAGTEIATRRTDWEPLTSEDRDAFHSPRWKRKHGVTGDDLARIEREKAKEDTGRWEIVPRYSADGRWFGVQDRRGVNVTAAPEAAWRPFSSGDLGDDAVDWQMRHATATIPASFMHAWDFIPGQDALVVVGQEHTRPGPVEQYTGVRFEADGYNWKQLWVAPLPVIDDNGERNLRFRGIHPARVLGRPVPVSPGNWKQWRPIPNTLRGIEPSVSPDGERVAYMEYTDGVLNLVTIGLDGSDKRYLTHFDDGTWMQRAAWSPDGAQLVVAIFRNERQDLYVMNADGSGVRPLMSDRWEDQDPYWASDGRIYFSSDPTGIFNIYRYDPANRSITQITNVIGGAQAPALTPSGNLLYSGYTAHGWKAFGVKKEDFLGRDRTSAWTLDVAPEAAAAAWESREDLSGIVSRPYRAAWMPPSAVPIFRLSNDSLDDLSLQGGGQVFLQDYIEDHLLVLQALLGSDTQLLAQYLWQGWYPNVMVTLVHADVKYTYGYLLDDDGDDATIGDQALYEGKNQQFQNLGALSVGYTWDDRFDMYLFGRGLEYGFRTTADTAGLPYQVSLEGGVSATFSNIAMLDRSANPYGGRNIDLTYTRGYTDVVYAPYGGHTVDDGELLDAYGYDKAELRWTEQMLVPAWGPVLTAAQNHRHTLQVDVQGGYIDRNVGLNDEFRAGGQHPFYWGSDSLRPNTQFAGYPGFGLSGETMAMINLAYRFPVRRELNRRLGPLYFYDVTAQIMGTAGNMWSYEAPEDPADYYRNEYGDRVAYDGSSLHREIPFVDIAHKNGNSLLYDAGAELRVSASLFNGVPWNSFLRLAYGFNEIRGYGDVNGDDIQDTTQNAIGDDLSNETEKPGVRVYVGLGTGW